MRLGDTGERRIESSTRLRRFVVEALGETAGALAEDALPESVRGARLPAEAPACEACVKEMLDRSGRRYRYPFVTCADCAPRTETAKPALGDASTACAACRAELYDPTRRHFLAEGLACAACGPHVTLVSLDAGQLAEGDEALTHTTTLLSAGAIVAIKGPGGYQLVVDANDDDAVRRLRTKKRRPHKPFAIMARDIDVLEGLVRLDDVSRRALQSSERPIVLCPKRGDAPVAHSVAPGLRQLGVMLPTTALQHLLLAEGPSVLVVTSGNAADEPIVSDDEDAVTKLEAIADALLTHDRAIRTRADDSVVRSVRGDVQVVRRARGLVADPIRLPSSAIDGDELATPSVLAVGAEAENALCLTRGPDAFLAQHIGGLGSIDAQFFFREVSARLTRELGVVPDVIVHDQHGGYASSRWALESGVRTMAVQHHHAHVASCLVENGESGRAIGVAFDGGGSSASGALLGGEFLVFDLGDYRRAGHLRPLALPGGDSALRAPWRLAVAALVDAGEPIDLVSEPKRDRVRALLAANIASHTTAAGRWFDAISALLGIRTAVTYESQPSCELEAVTVGRDEPAYRFAITSTVPFEVDTRPVVRAIAKDLRAGVANGVVAARFHATVAEIIFASCASIRRSEGLELVALSGDCFQSAVLTELTAARLERGGFRVLLHRRVPAGDGGIALGQAAIAVHRLRLEAQG